MTARPQRSYTAAARTSWMASVGVRGLDHSVYLRQLRLGLRQPLRHPDLPEHRDRRRQLGVCFIDTPRAAVQLAEAEAAVGLERAHPQLLGEGERLAVSGRGLVGVGGL